MNVTDIAIFLGRFHPLVVHLPIGFLMMAVLMWSWQKWKAKSGFDQAISFCLLLGTVSAAAACVIGFLLSTSGGYALDALDAHMWGGIVTTILAGIAYVLFTYASNQSLPTFIPSAVLIAMMMVNGVTGHLGGNLTHGSTYLTEYAPFIGERVNQVPLPTSIQEVVLFDHVIQPIIKSKCISCHNQDKRKGGLSLATKTAMLKGGENGSVFTTESAQSELIKRIHLSETDDEVMPPEGKSPLTETEIQLLSFWAENKSLFDSLVVDLANDTIQHMASVYLGFAKQDHHDAFITALEPVDALVIENLRASGVVIRELVSGSHRYDVTVPAALLSLKDASVWLNDLQSIAKNIVWLNVSNLGLTDEHVLELNGMDNLVKLRIEKNHISDVGMTTLAMLPNLTVINLYGNLLTDASVPAISKFKKLEKAYVWKTEISATKAGRVELVL